MALLIDKWAAAAPPSLRRSLSEGLESLLALLTAAVPAMAASVLSLWRKDRRPETVATPLLQGGQLDPDLPPDDDGGEAWRRRVFEDGPISVAILDPADRLIESNAAFQTLVGADRATVG